MPTFLSDPSPTVKLLFIVAAVIAAVVWWRTRRRNTLVVAVVTAALLGLLFLIDALIETPREQAERRVEAMAEAATAASGNRFVENLSPSFRYKTADREAVRRSGAWGQVREHQARIAVWGLGHDDVSYPSETEVEVGFYAKAVAPQHGGGLLRYVKARFVRDPDGQYRLKTMEFYATGGLNPTTPEDIPGFP